MHVIGGEPDQAPDSCSLLTYWHVHLYTYMCICTSVDKNFMHIDSIHLTGCAHGMDKQIICCEAVIVRIMLAQLNSYIQINFGFLKLCQVKLMQVDSPATHGGRGYPKLLQVIL